jgi:hypothetical protein
MTKGIRALAAACLILGILSFLWIVYDLYLIDSDLEGVLFGSKGAMVGIGYLPILLVHGAAFLLLLMLSSRHRGYSILKSGSLAVIGVYWYPYYLFAVLLLFSGSTLYYYKRS